MLSENRKTILIIEDDAALNHLYVKYLDRIGHQVTGAYSSQEALFYLGSQTPPDIVILDLEMGDGNGIGVLDQMCEEGFEHTKVVVVSGNILLSGMSKHTQRIDYILLKPISVRELTAFVNSL
jgi:DNA-binding response OmpR family regulator